MPMDYEMADYAFAETDAPAMADALLTAKITIITEEIPQDYSGVKTKTKTVDEIPIPPPQQLMGGPAPMMMAAIPPGLGQPGPPTGVEGYPSNGLSYDMPNQMAQPGGGSMGMQAVQDVMQMA